MTDLLALALRAIDDRTARPVLGDAVLESGWTDWRVHALLQPGGLWPDGIRYSGQEPAGRARSRERAQNLARRGAGDPTKRWVRAVAAVLLFGGWSITLWPGVESSRRPALRPEDVARILRDTWPSAAGISELAYMESPFFRMVRKDRNELRAEYDREAEQIRARIKTAYQAIMVVGDREPSEPEPRRAPPVHRALPAPASLRVFRRRGC